MAFTGIKQNGTVLTFSMKGISVAVANGLRRTILADIPIPGIKYIPHDYTTHDSIRFISNDTSLNNELIGQRLSLIPIHFTSEMMDEMDAEKMKLVIKLKNSSAEVLNLTSKDIEFFDEKSQPYPKDIRDKLLPPNPVTGDHVLIVPLKPNKYVPQSGEELHLEASLSVGTQKDWAGFAAASMCCYEFEVDEAKAAQARDEALKAKQSKRSEAALPPMTDKEIEEFITDFNCLDIARNYAKDSDEEPVSILFKVQSECGLKPAEIVSKAFRVIIQQLKDIAEGRKKIEVTTNDGIAVALLYDANHTIGNIMQSYMYDQNTMQIGYCMPHPLENNVRFKFNVSTESSPDELATFLQQQAAVVSDKLKQLQDTWNTATDIKAD